MSEQSAQTVLTELGRATPEAPISLGRYTVIGRLGSGGMGTVYEAIDRERGMKVALKTLSVADAAASVWLKHEFRIVADLMHEHLAPVYELASDRGIWFFTMERIDGVSLSRWARGESYPDDVSSDLPVSRTLVSPRGEGQTLRSPGLPSSSAVRSPLPSDVPTRRLASSEAPVDMGRVETSMGKPVAPTRPLSEVRRAVAELVSAVAALHEAGLRHGDIKPANVLVRRDGRVVLVDFGLVRPVSERREAQSASGGTPTFMAPEQFGGEHIGPEADWYAVGATLYRVLTGWLPFVAASMLDLYVKKTSHVPPSPRDLLEEIPLDLSETCMALMRPAPGERPSKDALVRVLTGQGSAPDLGADRPRRTLGTPGRTSSLVGREAELCALEQAYGAARAGDTTVVHAHGPSGIGKSSLVSSFLGAVHDVDRALVLRGRCYARENMPYKAFDRIVDALSDHLRRLASEEVEALLPEWAGELGRAFPALASVPVIAARAASKHIAHDAIELRRRAWVALGKLLRALRQKGPVVLAIDDLQWADADSARLLEELVRGADGEASLLFVILFRLDEARDNSALAPYFELTKALEQKGRLVDLALGGLAVSDAEELARATLRDLGAPESEGRARFLAKEARGIPFFIEELAHFVRARELDRPSDGGKVDSGEMDGREVSLDQAIRARVGALPAAERAIVEIVSVAASPLPQAIVLEAAGLDQQALRALLALRSASLVSWLGAGADDAVSAYHDLIRQSVIAGLDAAQLERHLALGRALAKRYRERDESDRGPSALVFEAIRHLGASEKLIDDEKERIEAASLHAEAGERALKAAAFPLAFSCFEGGIALLREDAWERNYALALRLFSGATESAYLSASWPLLDQRIADVKAHAATVMDELVAWEAQIDACAGRHQYIAAVDAALEVLPRLGVRLPRDPTEAELGEAIRGTLDRLTEVGPEGLLALPDLSDPRVTAATRIQVRVSPAAYFGKPLLLPAIACNLVTASIDRGVSTATPYALALFGIVLNTIDLYPVSHRWGEMALALLDRFPDRRLEAATRHILLNLVCCWMVPLHTILEPLRQVFDIGCRTGDYEYASYAAHGYVHNAIYAGRPLEPLFEEANKLGAEMRALGMVNAVHVHAPFEQLLKALTGRLDEPWSLDGDTFNEAKLLAAAEAEGSRSGIYVLSLAMGLTRYYFGRAREASCCFERARSYIDAAPSVWHQPIMHQFAALSACATWDLITDDVERASLRRYAQASLEALRKLASFTPVNFAHRVSLVEAELARVDGDRGQALKKLDQAIQQAREASWVNDIALANELAARCEADADAAKKRLRAARTGYAAWGAAAKSEGLATRIRDLG